MHLKHWRVPSLSPFVSFLHLSTTSIIAHVYVICIIFICENQYKTKN